MTMTNRELMSLDDVDRIHNEMAAVMGRDGVLRSSFSPVDTTEACKLLDDAGFRYRYDECGDLHPRVQLHIPGMIYRAGIDEIKEYLVRWSRQRT